MDANINDLLRFKNAVVRRNSYDEAYPRYHPKDDLDITDNNNNSSFDNDFKSNKMMNPYDDLYGYVDIPLNDLGLSYVQNPSTTDEDTDEDINLDYEYGYDYEKIIKDRLRVANSAFQNDVTSAIKKNSRVSFDSAVIAFEETSDINKEMEPSLSDTNQENGEKNSDLQTNNNNTPSTIQQQNQNNLNTNKITVHEQHLINKYKLPLNDTVKKENPDEFAKKIREAVAKYDAEHAPIQPNTVVKNLKSVNFNNNNEIEEDIPSLKPKVTMKNDHEVPIENQKSEVKISFNNLPDNKDRADNNKNNESKQKNANSNNDAIKSFNKLNSSSYNNNNINSTKKSPTSSPSPDENKQKIQIITVDQETSQEKKANEKNILAKDIFSKSSSSPDVPTIDDIEDNTNITFNKNNANIEMTKQQENKKTNDNNNNNNNNSLDNQSENQQKVLIEKDGNFMYVNSDEYIAHERIKSQSVNKNSKKNEGKIQNIRPSSGKQRNNSSTIQIPHPPFKPPSNPRKTVYTITPINNNNNKSNTSIQLKRQSRSADPSNSQKRTDSNTLIELRKTPDYGEFYRSPYAMGPVKSADTNANKEKKRLEMEKEIERKKKLENESAYKSWLEQKEEARREELRKKIEKEKKEKSLSPVRSSTEDSGTSYDSWLVRKRIQMNREKEFQNKVKQLTQDDTDEPHTEQERRAAFKQWLKRKLMEKNEAKRLEKLEKRKWANRYRRSRKHQRLSQAIEMAQAYGYTSYYYTTGFNH